MVSLGPSRSNILKRIPSRICLTSNLWTTCTIEGYICLTAHYIDNNWKLNSKILSFCAMPPPHTGIQLVKVMGDALNKIWDSVKYVKGSEGRMKVFEECVETVGLQFKIG
nr:zinc finger BED domain-containing protein RICESLEEPER 2-like [Ipomoea batatas]